ncbi:MAG TPA: DUF393 domain-containing protein [Nitrospiria bacterium]
MHKLPVDTLVYDRDCELCRWGRRMIERWDRRGRIRYLAFQDPRFAVLYPDLDRSDPDGVWPLGSKPSAMLFVDGRGDLKSGMEAFRGMLPKLPGGRLLSLMFYLPGVPWLANRFYLWLAANRYRLFGHSASE